jgi:hypothetical protein
MLGFVDKRDSQIKLVSDSKPHLLSRSDLESNAAWKSLCEVPQIVANPASNMTPSTVDAVTSPRHMTPLRRIAVIGNSLPCRVRPGKRNGRKPGSDAEPFSIERALNGRI